MEAIIKIENGRVTFNGSEKNEMTFDDEVLFNEAIKQLKYKSLADLLEETKEKARISGLSIQFLIDKA